MTRLFNRKGDSAMSEDFMDEVAQDLKQEKFHELWVKYGKKTIVAFCGVVVLVGAYSFWQHKQIQKTEALGGQYVKAIEYVGKNNFKSAHDIFESLSQSSHDSYRTMAKLELAGLALRPGAYSNLDTALNFYKDVKNDRRADPAFRHLATIQYIFTQLQMHKEKGGDTKEFDGYIKDLNELVDDHLSFSLTALELLGVLYFEKGDLKKASETFITLAQKQDLPRDMKSRVLLMNQVIASRLQSTQNKAAA